jgi:hypothetical protein
MNVKKFFSVFLNWEYWPIYMFYIPNVPYGIYLVLKSKKIVFFSAVNPAIKSSGNGTESKYDTVQLIPKKYRPKSVLIIPTDNFNKVLEHIKNEDIQFPLIVKPDVGFRGLLVKKISSEDELRIYLDKYPIKIILQEFISYPNECGLFYYRLPNKENGKITSITLKKFLTVKGDGISTISELILRNDRAKIYFELLKEIHQEKLNSVLEKDKNFLLNDIGNHVKGTQFISGNHLISNDLTRVLDTINMQIDGWYYGRLDIKYDSIEALERGEDFKILEINGIISEPTHIYDSTKYTYFQALKILRNHWKIIYEISKINRQLKQSNFTSTKEFLKEVRELKSYTDKVKKLSL